MGTEANRDVRVACLADKARQVYVPLASGAGILPDASLAVFSAAPALGELCEHRRVSS